MGERLDRSKLSLPWKAVSERFTLPGISRGWTGWLARGFYDATKWAEERQAVRPPDIADEGKLLPGRFPVSGNLI